MGVFFFLIILIILIGVNGFGNGDSSVGRGVVEKIPTTQPTTSQPTGFKAPSVPGDVDMNIPLVDFSSSPSSLLPIPKNSISEIATRYEEQKRGNIPGSVNVNQELDSEATTAMNSVAYIYITFVCLVIVICLAYLYRR